MDTLHRACEAHTDFKPNEREKDYNLMSLSLERAADISTLVSINHVLMHRDGLLREGIVNALIVSRLHPSMTPSRHSDAQTQRPALKQKRINTIGNRNRRDRLPFRFWYWQLSQAERRGTAVQSSIRSLIRTGADH